MKLVNLELGRVGWVWMVLDIWQELGEVELIL